MHALLLVLLILAAPAAAQRSSVDSVAAQASDSIVVYAAEDADAWPMPQNYREFEAALRELYPHDLGTDRPRAQVRVRLVVNLAGQAQHAQVVQSSDARFDAVSLQAVQRLRFAPARRHGAPVWVWLEVPVEWGEPEAAADSARSGNATDGYEVSAVDELPRLLSRAALTRAQAREYPPALRAAGVSATLQVRLRVEPDGTVTNAVVTQSSNHEFDAATLRAVRTLRFRPARIKGERVRVWVDLPIEW